MRASFDTDEDWAWWIPSREWAAAWVEGALDTWPRLIEDYRDRVRTSYAEEYEEQPDAFPLMSPTDVVIVVCFLHVWVYAGPAERDAVRVLELWEDPVLSEVELQHDPRWEVKARNAAGIAENFELIFDGDLQDADQRNKREGFREPFANYRLPGIFMPGWDIADSHAHNAALAVSLAQLVGEHIDRKALRTLRDEFADMETWPGERAQSRGLKFQPLVEGVLRAHGCEVEGGRHRPGEQVDLFVHRPFRALLECRWEKAPIGRPAVSELISKLTRDRPAIVTGIYVSMSGFTSEAEKEAREHARDRVVILLDRNNLVTLLRGERHIVDVFNEKVDALVRRY